MSDEKALDLIAKGLKITTMEDQSFSDELLTPIKIGTNLDYLFSREGGIFPGVNIMVPGTPGIGKTTVALDILSRIMNKGKEVFMFHAEMPKLDMFKLSDRFLGFKKVPSIFMDDHINTIDPEIILRAILQQGYDIVLIDSMSEMINLFAEYHSETPKLATSRFLDIIKQHNEGKNNKGKYTIFLLIQQVTKNDVFVGSNRLKHMTQGTMELRYKDPKNKSDPYIFFSKNRDAAIGQEIEFKFIQKEEGNKEQVIWYSEPSLFFAEHPSKNTTVKNKENKREVIDIDLLLNDDENDTYKLDNRVEDIFKLTIKK